MQQDEYKERKNRVPLALERAFFFFFPTLRNSGCCLGRHKWRSCGCTPGVPGSVTVPQAPGLASAAVPAAKCLHRVPQGLRGFPGLLNHENTGTATVGRGLELLAWPPSHLPQFLEL